MTDLKNNELDENTLEKECVGCGSMFVVFKEMADITNYCSKACSEAHSIFNIPNE